MSVSIILNILKNLTSTMSTTNYHTTYNRFKVYIILIQLQIKTFFMNIVLFFLFIEKILYPRSDLQNHFQ